MAHRKEYNVPAIEKAVSIINLLVESDKLAIGDICSRLNIPKTSVFLLLITLERHGLIEKDDASRYYPGALLFHWGLDYYKRIDVRKVARPLMQRLAKGTPYSIHLAVLMQDKPVYIEKVEGDGFIRFATTVGQSLPLHLSGVGKALATGMSDVEIRNRLENQLTPQTSKSPTRIEAVLEEIEFARKHGYTIEDEQMEEGIRCIGAPIYGIPRNIIAAISLTSTSKDLPAIKFQTMGEKVRNTALEISYGMGYQGGNEYESILDRSIPGGKPNRKCK